MRVELRTWQVLLFIVWMMPCPGQSLIRGDDTTAIIKLSPSDEEQPMNGGLFNIPVPTLGGRQFWGDVAYIRGWRIQENVFTKHFRLLDPGDVRRGWGTRAACEAILQQQRAELHLPPMSGTAVIYIHGIVRSSKSISSLNEKLQEEQYTVIGFDYPSTQVSMIESASYLHQLLESLEGIETIHFVCHSMGGLILRTYLQEHAADPRMGRIVMVGVPNRGARMANIMKDNMLYQFIYGPAGQQLIEDPTGFIAKLPVPSTEFAIIAGARGTPDGWNPLIPGDDDGTVSVDAAQLPGAHDSLTVPAMHSFMLSNVAVQEATLRFLKTGALREGGLRCPITAVATDGPVHE